MKYSVLELKPDFSRYVPPDLEERKRAVQTMSMIAQMTGQDFQPSDPLSTESYPIGIYIDGKSLHEIVREAEEPFVEAENDERIIEETDEEEEFFPLKAGSYLWLPASLIYLPSRNLLGEPYDEFVMEPTDQHWGKSVLLGCNCGVIGCWFVVVKITLTDNSVIWSEFGQFHRDWEYPIGPFVFDRKQYEKQLKSIY